MNKTLWIKTATIRLLLRCMAFFVVCGITAVASAQTRILRIVTYNIEADTGGYTTPRPGLTTPSSGGSVTNGGVLEGIGEEIIAGDPAQPIDVLALEETTSNTTTVQPIVDGLNTFYAFYTNPAGYAMSPYQAALSGSSGNGPNALVYNTNTVQLLASVPVDPPGGVSQLGSRSGEYREVMRYQFAPAGVTPASNNEFYIYVSHYKADTGLQNETNRLGEARIIRNDESTNLPSSARVLYVGDYNPDDNSGEPGYQTILSNAAPDGIMQGQGIDPLNTSAATNIDWSDNTTNPAILFMLSEDSYELQYRDDLQVMTSNVYYDVAGGLQYVQGSYHSFGNNASLPYGVSVTYGGTNNTALNDLDPSLTNQFKLSGAQLLQDLTTASDHLPIVADYTIPVLDPFTAWQLQYFTCTNCPQAAATADPDGDGQNNLAEYLAGTDPTSSTSALRIISAVRQGNDIAISWSTAGGHTNVMQVSAGDGNGNYATNNFADISGSTTIVSGSGNAITNYTDVGGASNTPSRFYRIRLVP